MFPYKLAWPLLVPLFILSQELPAWVSLSSLIFIFWRICADYLKLFKPLKKITGLLSLLFLAATYLTFETLLGRESAGSYLLVLSSLKILEYETDEENNFIILLDIFLICTTFLFNFDLIISILLILSLLYLIYQLIPSRFRQQEPQVTQKIYWQTLISALPLALALFFFFPRVSEWLWQFNSKKSIAVGQTGFSDELNPGTLGEITKSQKVVFRAEIFNKKADSHLKYWKGEVLTNFSKMQWNKGPSISDSLVKPSSIKKDYRVLLEPQNHRWIFALDGTQQISLVDLPVLKSQNMTFRLTSIPLKSIEYWGYIESQSPEILTTDELERIQKSHDAVADSERILQLIQSWSMQNPSTEDKINIILNYFKSENFRYTLKPHDENLNLDKFLFETKKGFCEHYASSTAILLRLMDVPARVVVGFLGGQYNQFGQFWSIRDKDAHAWVEYLDDQHRWVRLDPTSAIAPLRLELSTDDFYNLPEDLLGESIMNEKIKEFKKSINWAEHTLSFVQNLNYQWTTWLLNFDLEKQKELINRWSLKKIAIFIFSILIVSLFFIFFIQALRAPVRISTENKLWSEFLNLKKVKVLHLKNNLSPFEIQKILAETIPKSKMDIENFIQSWALYVYAQKSTGKPTIKELKRLLKLCKKSLN